MQHRSETKMQNKKMDKNYCIGIIPNQYSYSKIIEFKRLLEKKYKLVIDEDFIPVILLIQPFKWEEKNEYLMVDYLKKYSSGSFSFDLEFAGFEFFNEQISMKIVEKENISKFQKSLEYFIEIHSKLVLESNFDPKFFLNIAPETTRKRLKIWNDLKENSFNIHFTANKICLLNLKSGKWGIVKEFELE